MRTARLKGIRKMVKRLERVLRFRTPYNILLDTEFIAAYAKSGMSVDVLEGILGGPLKLWTTSCAYKKYKEASPDERRIIGLVDIKKCAHGHVSTLGCIKAFVGGGNRDHYFLGVGPRDRGVKQMKNVPIIYMRSGVLSVEIGEPTSRSLSEQESPPALTKKEKQRLEKLFQDQKQ